MMPGHDCDSWLQVKVTQNLFWKYGFFSKWHATSKKRSIPRLLESYMHEKCMKKQNNSGKLRVVYVMMQQLLLVARSTLNIFQRVFQLLPSTPISEKMQ